MDGVFGWLDNRVQFVHSRFLVNVGRSALFGTFRCRPSSSLVIDVLGKAYGRTTTTVTNKQAKRGLAGEIVIVVVAKSVS